MIDGRLDDAATRPWLQIQAERMPGATAVVCETGQRLSFAELAAGARSVARRLLAADVGRDSRLALLLRPSPRFVELVHAAQHVGAVIIPLNDRLHQRELSAQLEHADPACLVYDDEHAELAGALAARQGHIRAVHAYRGWQDLPAAPGPLPERLVLPQLHSVIYTSGTTGSPKGVMLTNGNHLASATASMARIGCTRHDCWLSVLPLYHVGGLSILLRAALGGMGVVVHARFEARAANRAIHEQGVTIVSLVPTMLARMLDDAEGRPYPSTLRCALLGGGPAPPQLQERARQAGLPVFPTYGLTETASQVCTATADDAVRHGGSAGRSVDGVDLRIAGPDPEGWGDILIRGPQVTPGYFRDPRLTSRTIVGGWLHTGDLGRVDADGRLWVAGRRDDVIITGGEKVVPDEVEAVLTAHPQVVDAAVFAQRDAIWGQRVAAAVVLELGAALDASQLEVWCRRLLAGFKVPRHFDFVAALPRTASGKLRRYRLRDPGPDVLQN